MRAVPAPRIPVAGWGTSSGHSRSKAEVVERRDAVCLRPYAHRSRACNMRVGELDVALAIERHRDALSVEVHPQDMPAIRHDWRRDILDGVSTPTHRVVERDVVLERVG